MISLIVAATTEYGIGKDNNLPWDIPEELNNFKRITSNVIDKSKKNSIIMGKNTWMSLPNKPLRNRLNIIVSTTLIGSDGSDVVIVNSVLDAIKYAKERRDIENTFIIGGEAIYNNVINNHISIIDKIYLSIITDKYYECDKFINMNRIYEYFNINSENIHVLERYMFMILDRKNKIVDEPVD
jgi:dihydrofolate reductase